jgi:peptidoglycan/LPS O-acetylase OafA/YrhL
MTQRVRELDGVRGIAILLVLLFHATYFYVPAQAPSAVDDFVRQVGGWGWGGVDLFFVLSGFLITGILLKTKEAPGYFRNFFTRRALRIFPLYFLYISVAFFVLPHVCRIPDFQQFQQREFYFFGYLANFAMMQFHLPMSLFFSHLWSVCVEEQFYICWPFAVFFIPNKKLRYVAAAMILFANGYRLAMLPVSVAKLMPACLDGLGAGALLAMLPRTSFAFSRISGVSLTLGGVAAVVAITLAKSGVLPSNLSPTIPWSAFSHTAVCIASAGALILALQARPISWLQNLLTSNWLRACGKYSYAMYIFHFPILFFDLKFGIPLIANVIHSPALIWLAAYGLNTCETLLLSMASYQLFEKHFLNFKERLAPEPSTYTAQYAHTPASSDRHKQMV